jgi:RNA polymerase sporulation-specific sigma factor
MNYDKCSDETLIDMYRMGNETAIEALFDRYKNLVRKKAKAMYIAGGDSDDLIQEGMIGLYKAARSYDETKKTSFVSFASLCIDRQIMTAVTASNREKNAPLNNYVSFELPAFTDDDSESIVRLADVIVPSSDQNPEFIFIDNEHARELKEQLDKELSSLEKKVLAYHMEGKDYRQIAEILGKSPKSVDNALQRIKSKAHRLNSKD